VEAYLISGWILGIVMIPVVAHRRRLTSALSWLALIFALPWLGAVLYVLVAEQARPMRSARRHRAIVDVSRTGERLRFQERWEIRPSPAGKHGEIGTLTRRLGGFAALGGNHVEVTAGDRGTLSRMIEDIDHAVRHVHLVYYIVEPDRTGQAVAEALERAVARGVRCRLLADALGSRRFHRRLAPRLREAGVDVRKVLSLPLLVRQLRPLDLRNHRKLMIVDGQIAYMGSMNLMDSSVPVSAEPAPWREVAVRVTGPAVLQMQMVFDEDWRHSTGETLPQEDLFPSPLVQGNAPLQVVPSGPNDRVDVIHDLLVATINDARQRIVLTTPYFIPDDATRVALKLAALRGVRVQIVIPRRSDAPLVDLAGRAHLESLLTEGVEVHEHHTGFLHAKTFTVDRTLAMIGSANFDRRSFHLNFELNLLLYEEESVEKVVRMQERYLADARSVTLEAWQARPRLRQWAEDVLRLLSPLF
jgi:cardiolipin synthase